jgi:hypothetical protein
MQAAIQKNNLMKQPMVVSLKGGASAASVDVHEGKRASTRCSSRIHDLHAAARVNPFNWRDLTPVSVSRWTSSCCGTTTHTTRT